MKLNRYLSLEKFRADVLPVLLEQEALNNLLIGIVSDTTARSTRGWFMGTVTDALGQILLVAFCSKPFNALLYAPKRQGGGEGVSGDECVRFLAGEMRRARFFPPGVMASSELAERFAAEFTGSVRGAKSDGTACRSLMLMRLDKLLPFDRASGFCRVLTEDDLTYVPLWEQSFNIECRIPSPSLKENTERIRTRLGRNIHYIWEDGVPVSQAVFGRETPHGAVINWVYTPPLYRSHGYATSVVGELSKSLLERSKEFCCLFADADNPISRGIYSKLGYYDVAEFKEIGF